MDRPLTRWRRDPRTARFVLDGHSFLEYNAGTHHCDEMTASDLVLVQVNRHRTSMEHLQPHSPPPTVAQILPILGATRPISAACIPATAERLSANFREQILLYPYICGQIIHVNSGFLSGSPW